MSEVPLYNKTTQCVQVLLARVDINTISSSKSLANSPSSALAKNANHAPARQPSAPAGGSTPMASPLLSFPATPPAYGTASSGSGGESGGAPVLRQGRDGGAGTGGGAGWLIGRKLEAGARYSWGSM